MNNAKKYKVSVIIPCKNEGIYIKQTLNFLYETEARKMCDIIVVDDNSNDHCCEFIKDNSNPYKNVLLVQTRGIGAARARNLGASLAASADILVFCDAHITFDGGWLLTLVKTFDNKEISAVCPGIGHFDPDAPAGYGQSWDENFNVFWLKKPEDITEIPLVPGGCMAIRKSVFDAVGGFDRSFSSWGFEDVELSIKLWLFGFKCFVHPGVKVGHKFRKVQPYDVDLTEFHHNKLKLALNHFNHQRCSKVIKSMEGYSNFDKIIESMISAGSFRKRMDYFNRRLYGDDWFFDKFNIPF